MQRLILAGLNHTTAPLAVREKIVFSADQRQAALREFRDRYPEAEAVLISTCNRVEMYVVRTVHGHPRPEEMIEFLAAMRGAAASEVAPHFYQKADRDAVAHLFAVTSSLDSMVLGETQILGQVRSAYEDAAAAGCAGPLLNPLLQRAIAVGKQVHTETTLGEGRLSVASVAVDYARRIFDHFADKTVLSIGAGKMAVLVLQAFAALRPKKLLICNRDPARAAALAGRFGGEAAGLDKLSDHLVSADIVISSTGSADPIITRSAFERIVKLRRYRPIFLIDIALPRDVEEAVGQMENVYLYNIDDLQQVVADTQSQRSGAIAAARAIVDREVEQFAAWNRTRELGPLIQRLYQRSQQMAAEEVARTVNKLGEITPQEKEHLEDLARRIVNKLLHEPIQTLRESDDIHGRGTQYLHAMERLFGLEEEVEATRHEGKGQGSQD